LLVVGTSTTTDAASGAVKALLLGTSLRAAARSCHLTAIGRAQGALQLAQAEPCLEMLRHYHTEIEDAAPQAKIGGSGAAYESFLWAK
jgi:hypothetical protein